MSSNSRIREDREKFYAVKKIIGVHIDEKNNTYYQIEWESTWEDSGNLIGCEHMIKEFWTRRSGKCFCKLPNIKQEPVDYSFNNIQSCDARANENPPYVSGQEETNTRLSNYPRETKQTRGASIKRKSRMTLSNLKISPLKRKLSENAARAMKSSSTLPRMQKNLGRIVSPTTSQPRRRGYGLRAGSLMSSSQNASLSFSKTRNNSSSKRTKCKEATASSGNGERLSISFTDSSDTPDLHHHSRTIAATKEYSHEIHTEDALSVILERNDKTTLNNSNVTSAVSEDEDDSQSGSECQDDTSFSSKSSKIFRSYTNIFKNQLTEKTATKTNKTKQPKIESATPDMSCRPLVPSKLTNYVTIFKCHLCPFTSMKKEELKKHFPQKHSLVKVPIKINYPCGQCDKHFRVKSHLVSHLMNHTKLDATPYKCTLCTESYTNVHELENHHLTHEYAPNTKKEKKARLGTLSMKNNNKEVWHQCTICKRSFASNRALLMHCRRRNHLIQFNKPMAIKGISNNKLKDRRSASAMKNPFESSKQQSIQAKIKAKYRRQKNTANTSKVKKPFNHNAFLKCPHCPRIYNNKNRTGLSTLNLHMEMKHKDKAFDVESDIGAFSKCPFCTRLFISTKALENHVINVHGIDKTLISDIAASVVNRKTRVANIKNNTASTSATVVVPLKNGNEKTDNDNNSDTVSLKSNKRRARKSINRHRAGMSIRQSSAQHSLSPTNPNGTFKKEIDVTNNISDNDSTDASEITFERKRMRGRPRQRPRDSITNGGNSKSSADTSSGNEQERNSHPLKKFQCKHCLRTYTTLQTAKKHIKIAHPNKNVNASVSGN